MTRSDYTHLGLIVDRSGSMRPIAADMEGAIRSLLEEQAKLPGELRIDVSVFDDHVEHRYTDVRADDVKGTFVEPRGMTALNDAIGITVTRLGERLAALEEEDRPSKVIIGIVTDGGENSSREYSLAQAKAIIEKQKGDYQWEFLFFGANSIDDVVGMASGYGVGRGHTFSFDHSAGGAATMANVSSGYMTRSRVAGDTSGFTEEELKQEA